jgi:hypothetical protein
MVWYGIACYGAIWYDVAWHDMARYYMVRYGMYGISWFGIVMVSVSSQAEETAHQRLPNGPQFSGLCYSLTQPKKVKSYLWDESMYRDDNDVHCVVESSEFNLFSCIFRQGVRSSDQKKY